MLMKKFDTIESLKGACVHHGFNNSRVYLMSMKGALPCLLPNAMIHLGKQKGYGKLIAKIRKKEASHFLDQGFEIEAVIPNYYPAASQAADLEDAVFVSLFLDCDRQQNTTKNQCADVLQAIKQLDSKPVTEPRYNVIELVEQDCEKIAALYRSVFQSYPFPIQDPIYIKETMADNISYFGIKQGNDIIAVASAEQDKDNQAVEMTDFATHPDYRGQGLATDLLIAMENKMSALGFINAFTIARAVSFGMNKTFYNLGYQYGGNLINNTQISGNIESMNVWYKSIQDHSQNDCIDVSSENFLDI